MGVAWHSRVTSELWHALHTTREATHLRIKIVTARRSGFGGGVAAVAGGFFLLGTRVMLLCVCVCVQKYTARQRPRTHARTHAVTTPTRDACSRARDIMTLTNNSTTQTLAHTQHIRVRDTQHCGIANEHIANYDAFRRVSALQMGTRECLRVRGASHISEYAGFFFRYARHSRLT